MKGMITTGCIFKTYVRVGGEWNRLRNVTKGRWQCNGVETAGSVIFWQKVLYGGGGGCGSYSTATYAGV